MYIYENNIQIQLFTFKHSSALNTVHQKRLINKLSSLGIKLTLLNCNS